MDCTLTEDEHPSADHCCTVAIMQCWYLPQPPRFLRLHQAVAGPLLVPLLLVRVRPLPDRLDYRYCTIEYNFVNGIDKTKATRLTAPSRWAF